MIHGADGRAITSAGSWLDNVDLMRDAVGETRAAVRFPALALLKGRYTVSAYVLCERAINVYAAAEHVTGFDVFQDDALQGVVALPRHWRTGL